MTRNDKICILIAEHIEAMRQSIRRLLDQAGNMEVVGEAKGLEQALEIVRQLEVEVVILEDTLPPLESGHAAVFFLKQGILTPVLALSTVMDPDLIQHAFRQGVYGFMHRDEIDDHLVEAVGSIHAGERYFSPRVRTAYPGNGAS